jgi:hypothetical protein
VEVYQKQSYFKKNLMNKVLIKKLLKLFNPINKIKIKCKMNLPKQPRTPIKK